MLWKISTATTKIAFSIGGVDAYSWAADDPLNVAVAAGINGNGSSATSFRVSSTSSIGLGEIYNYSCNLICQIQNYSNATTYKTNISRANSASDYTQAIVGLWRNTAAITSITILTSSGTFNTGSTFTLYGIAAA